VWFAAAGYGGNIPAHAGKTPPSRPPAGGVGGTSPRTRGKRHGERLPNLTSRNIPAHAGKTGGQKLKPIFWMEHPRARGENVPTSATPLTIFGTSPRTRGKQKFLPVHHVGGGNIPAHAGKTARKYSTATSFQEHPRARGENRARQVLPDEQARNIPAHAGKTIWAASDSPLHVEHPRARGENYPAPELADPFGGTSPRTRGKLRLWFNADHIWGNIPAHAGKTFGQGSGRFG